MSPNRAKAIRDYWTIMLVAVVVLVLVIYWLVNKFGLTETIATPKQMNFDAYSTLMANLFFIAVIIERFIEVFNSIWRRKGRLTRLRAIDNAQNEKTKEEALKELDDYRARTETLAMNLAFAIGILTSLAGVRILQTVYHVQFGGFQKLLFLSMDILLTAGLLAGGSKGINAVTAVFGAYLEMTKEKAGKSTDVGDK